MSLTFKFDGKNNTTGRPEDKTDVKNERDIELYETVGNARNVYFITCDGKHKFLNYSYLIDGEYSPEENSLVLSFTSHTVTLKGTNLKALMKDFFTYMPKYIKCVDNRYVASLDQSEVCVTEINWIENM